MPPRVKFTKQQIVNTALDIVRENGIDALNVRAVGKKLGTSTSPVFTFFSSVEELKEAVFDAAEQVYYSYTDDWRNYSPPAKRWAMQMLAFAKEEPKLFQLLFMQESIEIRLFEEIDVESTHRIPIYEWGQELGLTDEQAHTMFYNLWIILYGMCTMIARNVCTFTDEELAERVGAMFAGQLMFIHSDKKRYAKVIPQEGKNLKIMGIDASKTPYDD